jgi:ribonuclease P protein component
VVRNTVTRRLRALVRDRLDVLPAGSTLVVRALPPAGSASFAELGEDLDACLAKLFPSLPLTSLVAGPASPGAQP